MTIAAHQALPSDLRRFAPARVGIGMLDVLLFVYVFVTQLAIRRLTGSEKLATDPTKLDISNIGKAALWTFGLLVAAWLLRRHTAYLLRPPMRYILIFFAWMLVTCLYSPERFKAVFMVSTLLSVFFVYLAFAEERGLPLLFDRLIQIQTVFLGLSIILYFAIPSVSHMLLWDGSVGARMTGIGGHPNQTGVLAAFIIVSLYARCDSGTLTRHFKFAAIVIALTTLVLTQSRTSLIATGVGCMAFFLLKNRWHATLIPVLICLGIAAILVVSLDSQILAIFARSGDADELLTGTGRSFIWDLSWGLIKRAPLLGYGFNSTYTIFMDEAYLLAGDVGIYIFPHSHNLVLQLLLYGGVVGLVLFMLPIASIAAVAVKARDPRIAALLACYLSFTMTEPGGFFQYADNMIVMLVLATVAAQVAAAPYRRVFAIRQNAGGAR
ncbi:O-antigen ligase family protein [Taklimakanibacter lacteus]|uniref:O-antigen ligase family protein n=1 Tax=Taklimakanibacter lacteus TaxID=2268456 RepID=UPI000E65F788